MKTLTGSEILENVLVKMIPSDQCLYKKGRLWLFIIVDIELDCLTLGGSRFTCVREEVW